MLKRVAKIITGALCASLLLTGCTITPELNITDEEADKIVGYSAELLLKYNKSYEKALMTDYELNKAEAKIASKVAAALAGKKESAEPALDSSPAESRNNAEDSQTEATMEVSENVAVSTNIAQTIGVGDFDISFDRIEICETYPSNIDGTAVFTMRATGGNELIICHFKIKNVTETGSECNILNIEPSFQMIFNNGEKTDALTTILTNDLARVDEVIEPEDSYDAILAFEKPKGFGDTVETTELMITVSDNKTVISLSK